jgi:hypothetical protein
MGSKKISELNLSSNPNMTGFTIFDDGSGSYKVTLSTLRDKLVDSGSHNFTGNQSMSGSLSVSGSFFLPQVSSSLNFVNDTAAASGGVPRGGLYRSGSFILIRLV